MQRLRPAITTTALITPFRDGALDLSTLERLVERQIECGIGGLAVCTATGEGPTLSQAEQASVIGTCVRVSAGRVPIIAATGTNMTASTVSLTLQAECLGADAALVTVPYYSKPGQKGILNHFETVATASGLPLLIDDCPERCGTRLSLETLEVLAEMPSVVGIVGAGQSFKQDIPLRMRHRLSFLSSDDGAAVAFLVSGGHGVVSSGANVQPRLFADLQRAAHAGKVAIALALQERLLPLIRALGTAGDPSPIKHALHLLTGLDADVRLPMVGLDPAEKAALFDALTDLSARRAAALAACH